MMTLKRSKPATVAPPLGSYSHLTVIPRDYDLLVLAGQVGIDQEGNVPEDVHEQLALALENARLIMASEGVDETGLVKVNMWLTEQIDRPRYVAIWDAFRSGQEPSATLGYVAALTQPKYKVEVEVIAARPANAPKTMD